MTGSVSSRRHLFANLNWVLSANLVSGLANFLAIAWFARQLGPAVMGDYAVVVTALQLLAAFFSAGFDQAIIRSPNEPNIVAAANVATIAQSVLLILASGVAYLIYFWRTPEGASNLAGPGMLVLLAIILSFFFNLLAAPLAAALEYRRLSLIRLLSTLIGLGTGVSLVYLNAGVYALVARDLAMSVIMLALIGTSTPARMTFKASRNGFLELARFASGLWSLNMLERVSLRLDYALVGWIFGKEVLGMYFAVRSLIEGVLGFAVNPIQTVLYAHYCRTGGGALTGHSSFYRVGVAYWAGCALLAFLSYFLARTGVALLLGKQYQVAHVIVPGLILYAGAIIWFENVKVLAMARHVHARLLVARLAQLFVFLLLIYPLASIMGFFGAGLTTGVSAITLAYVASRQILADVRGGQSNPALWKGPQ